MFVQSARTNFCSGHKTSNLPTLSCLNCVYCLWYKLIAWMAFRNNGKSWLWHESRRLKQHTHFPLFCHFPWKCQRVIELGKSIGNQEVWRGRRQNPAHKHFDTRPNWGLHKHLFSPKCICLPCRYNPENSEKVGEVGDPASSMRNEVKGPGGWKREAQQSDKVSDMLAFIYFFWQLGNSTEHWAFELCSVSASRIVH